MVYTLSGGSTYVYLAYYNSSEIEQIIIVFI